MHLLPRLEELMRRGRSFAWVLSILDDAMLRVRLLAQRTPFAADWRRVRRRTMIGPRRLIALANAVEAVIQYQVPGDVVECGVARGGSAALLALTMVRFQAKKALWLFDTFEGIPAPTLEDPDYRIAKRYTGKFRGEIDDVRCLLDQCGLKNLHITPGLFEETVETAAVRSISLLHIDGDWYQSVLCCLEGFYDRVAPGGLIQIDDYGHWEGARKAVDTFRQRRRITAPMKVIDYSGRQWTKP